MLSRRDRLRLETTRPSDPRTETILRQLKGMGNGLSAPRNAKKSVVLGLDVNFTKRERERILHERKYQLAFWVIMGHGGKQVSEKSRSELRRVVVEKKEAWGIFEYPESIRRALFAFHDLNGQTGDAYILLMNVLKETEKYRDKRLVENLVVTSVMEYVRIYGMETRKEWIEFSVRGFIGRIMLRNISGCMMQIRSCLRDNLPYRLLLRI